MPIISANIFDFTARKCFRREETIKVAHSHCFYTSRNKLRKMGCSVCSVFFVVRYFVWTHSGFAFILMGRAELVALVSLSSCFSWLLCYSFSRCHGFVCSLGLWYFLIILTYYIKCALFAFNFSCNSYQICFLHFVVYLFLKLFLVFIKKRYFLV